MYLKRVTYSFIYVSINIYCFISRCIASRNGIAEILFTSISPQQRQRLLLEATGLSARRLTAISGLSLILPFRTPFSQWRVGNRAQFRLTSLPFIYHSPLFLSLSLYNRTEQKLATGFQENWYFLWDALLYSSAATKNECVVNVKCHQWTR